MGLNFSTMVYEPNYDMFARPVTFVPQDGSASYGGRGIYNSGALNVMAEDGSIFADQGTILDIREVEFVVLPVQNDHVIIGPDSDVPAEGEFVITDTARNGGGETTLTLSKWTP
jgi:hypothetical protein